MTTSTIKPADKRDRFAAWPIAVLVVLAVPIIFYGLGNYSPLNNDEVFYHYVARNMVETGDWFRLEFTGEHRVYDTFMNAPIQYWARAALIAAFGDNRWTMRIMSSVFGLLAVLMTYRLAVYVAGTRAAFLASLIQLTLFQYVYQHCARTGELEPILCFVFTLLAYLFLRAIETGRSFVPHHVCLIVLMNLKLPLVIVPVLAELAYFAMTPEARRRFTAWMLAGLILPLGLVWHVAQLFLLGDEAWHVFQKMAGQASGAAAKRDTSFFQNACFYAKTVMFGTFPYALAFPPAVVGLLAVRTNRQEHVRMRLLVLYPVAVVVFFIFVRKFFPWYIIPAYPFLCVFLGIWLDRLRSVMQHTWLIAVSALLCALLIWIRPEWANPFFWRELKMAPEVTWRQFLSLSPALGILITGGLFAVGLYASRALLRDRFAAVVAYGLTVVLIGYAGVRILQPLKHTHYVSPMETLKYELATDRAAGKPYRFPIPITERGIFKVRYFFGDDFKIVRRRPVEDIYYWLTRQGYTSTEPPWDKQLPP